MKLVRYGNPGKEKPGLIDAAGKLRDLSQVIADVTPEQLSDKALAKLAKSPRAVAALARAQEALFDLRGGDASPRAFGTTGYDEFVDAAGQVRPDWSELADLLAGRGRDGLLRLREIEEAHGADGSAGTGPEGSRLNSSRFAGTIMPCRKRFRRKALTLPLSVKG